MKPLSRSENTAGAFSTVRSIFSRSSFAPVDPDFPASEFNHVIICVPNGKDSIWLECTSNANEPGFLGNDNEDKLALLLTENGGQLVKTPGSRSSGNMLSSRHELLIDESDYALTKARITTSGDFYPVFHYITQMSTDEQKEVFVRYFGYRSPDDFRLSDNQTLAKGKFGIDLLYDQFYDFKAGSKYFISQRLVKLIDDDLRNKGIRTMDYVLEFPYVKRDTTVFQFPAGFSPEQLPPRLQIDKPFASYSRETTFDPATRKLQVVTELKLEKNRFSPDEYLLLSAFFEAVAKDESEKLVMRKE